MNYNKLKELCQERHISIKDLCEKASMSFAGIKRGWENETIEVRKARLISEILGVPLTYWETMDKPATKRTPVSREEIQSLFDEVAGLRKIIEAHTGKP